MGAVTHRDPWRRKGLEVLLNFALGDMSDEYYRVNAPIGRITLNALDLKDRDNSDIYDYLRSRLFNR